MSIALNNNPRNVKYITKKGAFAMGKCARERLSGRSVVEN